MVGPTHEASAKNAPANNAITGSFAPHGINGVSMAVALLSLSFRMVRHAMIPGIAHPVPITIGITDFPDKPTLLKIGSKTTGSASHISAVFQKSNQEIHNHYQRQETDYCAYASNDAIHQKRLKEWILLLPPNLQPSPEKLQYSQLTSPQSMFQP